MVKNIFLHSFITELNKSAWEMPRLRSIRFNPENVEETVSFIDKLKERLEIDLKDMQDIGEISKKLLEYHEKNPIKIKKIKIPSSKRKYKWT